MRIWAAFKLLRYTKAAIITKFTKRRRETVLKMKVQSGSTLFG